MAIFIILLNFAGATFAGEAENATYIRITSEEQFREHVVGRTWQTIDRKTWYLLKPSGAVKGKWKGQPSNGRWWWDGSILRSNLVTGGERERERIEVYISTDGIYRKEVNLTYRYTVYYVEK